MEHIVEKKTDETQRRWEVAIKDKNFDCIRNLPVAETRPEHFDRALADGKVSTNVWGLSSDHLDLRHHCSFHWCVFGAAVDLDGKPADTHDYPRRI
jgi:hypothetical protein